MTVDSLVAMVQDISTLVQDRRYELALAVTERLEEELARIPADDPAITPPVRDMIAASGLLTQSLVTLRGLAVH